jgi:hypothetical protein
MIVLTPPSKVYSKISSRITNEVTSKGMWSLSKINACRILITKYKRAVAPTTLDNIKKKAPALCALIPKAWIEERDISELIDDGFSMGLLRERARVFDQLKF